jgi:hypothetical protein
MPDRDPDPDPAVATPEADRGRAWVDALVALAVGLATLGALVATSGDYGMVWDEGHTVRRDRVLADWFARVFDPPTPSARSEAFSRRVLERCWPFSREEPDGHPPFYALLGLAGWRLSRDFLDPLTSYRFGPMALASLAVGVVNYHLARRYGRLAGATGAASLILMPRVFSHAHYAHYDMPMTSLWLLAQVAFSAALRSPRGAWAWALPFGVSLGLAMGTKFTGWFAPVPALLWTFAAEGPSLWNRLFGSSPPLRGDRTAGTRATLPGVVALAVGLPVAALVLVLIQPPWWADPIDGVRRFLVSNLSRSQTKPIPTMYLGRFYAFSLPWHNTLVLTAVTTPVFVLALGAVGLVRGLALRGKAADPVNTLWVLSWGVLMVVRALPSAPGHDGVRLFLPSVASLAVLAGVGVSTLTRVSGSKRLARAGVLLGVLAAGECALGLARFYPYTLSYYNAAIGGLPGAERAGFELTYYWDTMAGPFFDWLRERDRAEPGRVELRFPNPLVNVIYLKEWGKIPKDVRVLGFDPTSRTDYVLQRRRGVYYPYDWWLERHGTPSFVVRREGVDLLRVYPFSEAFKAFKETKDEPIPAYLRN